MNLHAWLDWSRQDTMTRAVVISLVLVAVMVLAQAVSGMDGSGTLTWDITQDPASGLLPF